MNRITVTAGSDIINNRAFLFLRFLSLMKPINWGFYSTEQPKGADKRVPQDGEGAGGVLVQLVGTRSDRGREVRGRLSYPADPLTPPPAPITRGKDSALPGDSAASRPGDSRTPSQPHPGSNPPPGVWLAVETRRNNKPTRPVALTASPGRLSRKTAAGANKRRRYRLRHSSGGGITPLLLGGPGAGAGVRGSGGLHIKVVGLLEEDDSYPNYCN